MQSRTLAEFIAQDYSEDRTSKHAFARRYRWVGILAALLVFAPYPLIRFGWHPFADPDPSLILRTGLCERKNTAYEGKSTDRTALRP